MSAILRLFGCSRRNNDDSIVEEVFSDHPPKKSLTSPFTAVKNTLRALSGRQKALISITVIVAVVLAAIGSLLYAKFGHNPTMNYWMNHQFQPFFTDKLGHWLSQTAHQAGEWISNHTLPTWVSVALGTTAIASVGVLGGMATKKFVQYKKEQREVEKVAQNCFL